MIALRVKIWNICTHLQKDNAKRFVQMARFQFMSSTNALNAIKAVFLLTLALHALLVLMLIASLATQDPTFTPTDRAFIHVLKDIGVENLHGNACYVMKDVQRVLMDPQVINAPAVISRIISMKESAETNVLQVIGETLIQLARSVGQVMSSLLAARRVLAEEMLSAKPATQIIFFIQILAANASTPAQMDTGKIHRKRNANLAGPATPSLITAVRLAVQVRVINV